MHSGILVVAVGGAGITVAVDVGVDAVRLAVVVQVVELVHQVAVTVGVDLVAGLVCSWEYRGSRIVAVGGEGRLPDVVAVAVGREHGRWRAPGVSVEILEAGHGVVAVAVLVDAVVSDLWGTRVDRRVGVVAVAG